YVDITSDEFEVEDFFTENRDQISEAGFTAEELQLYFKIERSLKQLKIEDHDVIKFLKANLSKLTFSKSQDENYINQFESNIDALTESFTTWPSLQKGILIKVLSPEEIYLVEALKYKN